MATVNPTEFDWVPPTTDTDGNPLPAGAITGYQIGIRAVTTPPTTTAGTYLLNAQIASPATTKELFTQLGTVLAVGSYAAAIKTVGPAASAYGPETSFAMKVVPSNPPTGFVVG